jgi:hypothetical protein
MSANNTVTINGYEFPIWDSNITSDEIAFASFSGQLARASFSLEFF